MEVYHDCWNADCPNLAIASCLGSTSCCEKSPAVPGGTPPGKLAILVQKISTPSTTAKKNDDPQIPNSHQTRKPGKRWKFKNLQIFWKFTLVKKWTHRRRKLAVRSAASCGG